MSLILRVPEYYTDFHCVGGSCPRNCCVGWEIAVDEKTAAAYRAFPGPLGDCLRQALSKDADGEYRMVRQGRRCSFLDEKNLCRIQAALGSAYTSEVCRVHPRFTEEYGPLREISLSASCPEVARLLLFRTTPLSFPEWELPEPGTEPDEWLEPLLLCRSRMLEILCRRSLPWRTRAAWALLFANEAQTILDDGDRGDLEELCLACAQLPLELPAQVTVPGEGLFPAGLRVLEQMEILEEDWPALLRAAERPSQFRLPDWALERISCYFIFRYLLHTVNDGDLLSRAELAVFGPLTAERLASRTGTAEAALYRFCRELEHDRENLKTLQSDFCSLPSVSLGRFFEELSAGADSKKTQDKCKL